MALEFDADFVAWAENEMLPQFVEHYAEPGAIQCPWCLWMPGRAHDPIHSGHEYACLLEDAKAWLRKASAPAPEEADD